MIRGHIIQKIADEAQQVEEVCCTAAEILQLSKRGFPGCYGVNWSQYFPYV